MILSAKDPAVYDVMASVMNMTNDDKALLSPQMVLKVLAFKASKWFKQMTGGQTETAVQSREDSAGFVSR